VVQQAEARGEDPKKLFVDEEDSPARPVSRAQSSPALGEASVKALTKLDDSTRSTNRPPTEQEAVRRKQDAVLRRLAPQEYLQKVARREGFAHAREYCVHINSGSPARSQSQPSLKNAPAFKAPRPGQKTKPHDLNVWDLFQCPCCRAAGIRPEGK
jgi:hypothetical protein